MLFNQVLSGSNQKRLLTRDHATSQLNRELVCKHSLCRNGWYKLQIAALQEELASIHTSADRKLKNFDERVFENSSFSVKKNHPCSQETRLILRVDFKTNSRICVLNGVFSHLTRM